MKITPYKDGYIATQQTSISKTSRSFHQTFKCATRIEAITELLRELGPKDHCPQHGTIFFDDIDPCNTPY